MGAKRRYLIWTRDFSVRNAELDKQHQVIFEIANDTLYTLDKVQEEPNSQVHKEELKKIMIRLFNYIRTHFSSEEKFMKEINFPLLKQHKKSHADLTNQAKKLLNYSGDIEKFSGELRVLIGNFITKHFAREDLLIADFVNKALDINEVRFNLDQYMMLKTLEDENVYNEKTYNYICTCSLQNVRKVPESIHNELENLGKLIKCRYCGKVLVFIEDFDMRENCKTLEEKFLSIGN